MPHHAFAHATAATLLCVTVTSTAFAQMGLPAPPVEVGIDTFVAPSDYGARFGLAPRVTFNLDPRTSLTARGDALINRQHDGPFWRESRTYDVVLRRSLSNRGRFSLDGLLGVGYDQQRDFYPGFSYRMGSATITVPDTIHTEQGGMFLLGVSSSHRLGRFVSLHEDLEVTIGPFASGVIAHVGAGVPVGRFLARRGGQQALIGSQTLRTGDRVWVTQDDGAVVEGVIGDVNRDAIEVLRRSGRTMVETSRAQRIEVPDGIGDGAKRGALIGAIAGGVLGALAGVGLCEDSCGNGEFLLFAAAGAGYGVGLGSLIGALSDSLHGGRTTVLDRSHTTRVRVRPVAGRQSLGLRAALGW